MTHTFSFFRVGGFNQVRLQSGADLLNLDQLDQKLWVALACPTHGLEFDKRTLEMIDSDKDGRIRANELIAAIEWAGALLKDADELVRAPSALNLAVINDSSTEGKQLLQAARTVLKGLGKPGADSISVSETADALKAFNAIQFSCSAGTAPLLHRSNKAFAGISNRCIATASVSMPARVMSGIAHYRSTPTTTEPPPSIMVCIRSPLWPAAGKWRMNGAPLARGALVLGAGCSGQCQPCDERHEGYGQPSMLTNAITPYPRSLP